MTKAKASQRAKGNALKKAKKRAASAKQAESSTHPGTFNPGNQSIKGPSGAGPGKVFGGAKRGSARSS